MGEPICTHDYLSGVFYTKTELIVFWSGEYNCPAARDSRLLVHYSHESVKLLPKLCPHLERHCLAVSLGFFSDSLATKYLQKRKRNNTEIPRNYYYNN